MKRAEVLHGTLILSLDFIHRYTYTKHTSTCTVKGFDILILFTLQFTFLSLKNKQMACEWKILKSVEFCNKLSTFGWVQSWQALGLPT